MACIECGGSSLTFNERMGERICDDCGLVEVIEAFEQTVSQFDSQENVVHSSDARGLLGTMHKGKYSFRNNKIQTGLIYCNMVLSSIMTNHPLRDRVEECYLSCIKGGVFTLHHSYENRATSLVFYVLKENNSPITLKKVCGEFHCDMRKVNKLVRAIATHFGNSSVYARDNTEVILLSSARKVKSEGNFVADCIEVHELLKPHLDAVNFTKGRTYCAAICCITSKITCANLSITKISKELEYSNHSVGKQIKKILTNLGIKSLRDIEGKEIQGLRKLCERY